MGAAARDSSWLLCENGKLAVNTLEHRSGATSRQTDIALIYGANILTGVVKDTSKGPVSLSGGGSSFKGTVEVDYGDDYRLTIKGRLILADEKFNISYVLPCKELEGEL